MRSKFYQRLWIATFLAAIALSMSTPRVNAATITPASGYVVALATP